MAGGTASARPRRNPDGAACVLKVPMPLDMTTAHVRLAAFSRMSSPPDKDVRRSSGHDGRSSAMLLERLGPNLARVRAALPARSCEAITRRCARSGSRSAGLPGCARASSRGVARRLRGDTWERLGRPCERPVIDRAVGLL